MSAMSISRKSDPKLLSLRKTKLEDKLTCKQNVRYENVSSLRKTMILDNFSKPTRSDILRQTFVIDNGSFILDRLDMIGCNLPVILEDRKADENSTVDETENFDELTSKSFSGKVAPATIKPKSRRYLTSKVVPQTRFQNVVNKLSQTTTKEKVVISKTGKKAESDKNNSNNNNSDLVSAKRDILKSDKTQQNLKCVSCQSTPKVPAKIATKTSSLSHLPKRVPKRTGAENLDFNANKGKQSNIGTLDHSKVAAAQTERTKSDISKSFHHHKVLPPILSKAADVKTGISLCEHEPLPNIAQHGLKSVLPSALQTDSAQDNNVNNKLKEQSESRSNGENRAELQSNDKHSHQVIVRLTPIKQQSLAGGVPPFPTRAAKAPRNIAKAKFT